MIVQRLTFTARSGRRLEAAELARAEREQMGGTYRIYLGDIGPRNDLAMEFEFEGLGEMEAFWSEWFATPESAAFMEKWDALFEAHRTNEIWAVIE